MWFELKEEAITKRRQGVSMTIIERELGIPRSTLSGWFRKIPLSSSQKHLLEQSRRDGWAKARAAAVVSHHRMKEERMKVAYLKAASTLAELDITPSVIELALAMLYFGEGAKANTTSISNSNPVILRFFVSCLWQLYAIPPDSLRCDLHLRADQDGNKMKKYWSKELSLPSACFKYVVFDKRTAGKKTYDSYKGVCVISYGNIAIQRKLVLLYTLFCNKVESLGMGA